MWALLLLAAALAIPLTVEANRKPMNAKARRSAPGKFATLSQGVTHFQWHGPETGPVAICIHGLTTPSFVWGSIADGLVKMSFRVLTYDLYGRGFSDRPPGLQDARFFLRQLDDLMEDQQVGDDITLIGYSMGGAIATAFAADHPRSLRQLVLLAPAGSGRLDASVSERLVDLPVIGTWLMLLRYPTILRNGLQMETNLQSSVPDIAVLQEAELDWRGFVPAVRESLRGILASPLEREHRRLAAEELPVLAIWGAEDTVIPLAASEIIAGWNRNTQNRVIEGAGHGLNYTHSDEVLALFKAFNAQTD